MTRASTPLSRADEPERSDEELIERVLQGDTPAFEWLMRRYNERVYRAARAIVRDEHEAEDVMQQAYVNAFANLHQFVGAARFSTWLTRIAINESLARVRRRGMYDVFDEERPPSATPMPTASARHRRAQTLDPSDNPEHQAFARELRALLERAVDTLPDGMREVFVLRDVEGLSTAEVAECLGLTEDAVKTRLSRGRATLRRLLLERTGATAPEAFRFHRPRCDRIVASVLEQITLPAPSPS